MGELKSILAESLPIGTNAAFFGSIPLCAGGLPRPRKVRRMQQNHPPAITFVLGGVRSGKSRYAQQLGERAEQVVFVATARASDQEMRKKIDRHRAERPAHWRTVEEPLDLAAAIAAHQHSCDLIIVDCLTIFAANLLEAAAGVEAAAGDSSSFQDSSLSGKIDELCRALRRPACSVVLVSNEVGSGVVPPYPLGRRFRDLLGEINQAVATVADHVLLMVAGLPLSLKGSAGVAGSTRGVKQDPSGTAREQEELNG